jgi:GNAT superfamily N-acetyltransferase
MDHEIVRPSDASASDIVRVIEANWIEFYARLGRAPGAELSVGRHLSWLLTGIPDAFLNVVFRTGLPPDHAGEVVDEALAHFRARRISTLSWWAPGADAGRLLASRGLTFDEGGTGMAADLGGLPESVPTRAGLVIVPVEDRASLWPWVRVMRVGFETPEQAEPDLVRVFAATLSVPQMRTYLALRDGRPVATSQLLMAAGVAGVYNVTCLPDARGQGIGAAVTLAALLEARQRGYRMAILQASDLGSPVYRRLGFAAYGRLNRYLLDGAAPGGMEVESSR